MSITWKMIPNYPNYEASNTGEIRNKNTFRILKQKLDKYGYARINLRQNNKQKAGLQVHRLIAKTFLLDWDENLQVDHIDHNKQNNNINNLKMFNIYS